MFIGLLLHIQSVDLHLSHYMKFYDTVHGYNTIPAKENLERNLEIKGIVK